jgi:hypothetical protein
MNNHKTKQVCHQCGNEFSTNEAGIATHINEKDLHNIDYDLDEDHTAYEL